MALTEEQKAIRSRGIGSSEIAILAGLDRYRSPMDLYLRKRGIVEDEAGEAAEWGDLLEPVIAKSWAETHGADIVPGQTQAHAVKPWAIATPDFRLFAPEVIRGDVLEVKTAGLRLAHLWGASGSDEVPEAYIVQVQWQCAVVGARAWHLAALIGGQEMREYQGEADGELAAGLFDLAERFWKENVLADVPPAPDASGGTRRWLAYRYPRHVAAVRRATQPEAQLVLEYDRVRAEIRKLDEQRSLLGNQIAAAIGDAEGLEGEGFRVLYRQRKGYTRKAIDVKAGRQLLVKVEGAESAEE